MAEPFLNGGIILWVIAGLSIITLTLIMWKAARLFGIGAFGAEPRVSQAILSWRNGDQGALEALASGRSHRAALARAAMEARRDPNLSDQSAREETEVVARNLLVEARRGLRALDLIVTIAPLLGLLGTVLGMIDAFQALQETGARADPATLAGGIWEALLTTAAGMGVAIPASMALTWFDSVTERLQGQMEDDATRIFAQEAQR